MGDFANPPEADPAGSLAGALAELERRVQVLEAKVAALPDARQIEERDPAVSKTNSPTAVDPTLAPSFKDIALPIPSVQTVLDGAKSTWALYEIFLELRMLFWTLFDRRYHMAWVTRVITIALVTMILTSHWWAPLATFDNTISHLWDKAIDLALGLVLFT